MLDDNLLPQHSQEAQRKEDSRATDNYQGQITVTPTSFIFNLLIITGNSSTD